MPFFKPYDLVAFLENELREPHYKAMLLEVYGDPDFVDRRNLKNRRRQPGAVGRALLAHAPTLAKKLVALLENGDPEAVYRWNDRGLPDRRRALQSSEFSAALAKAIGRIVDDEMETHFKKVVRPVMQL